MHKSSHFLGFVFFFSFQTVIAHFSCLNLWQSGHYSGGVFCMSAATVLHKTCKLMLEECVILDA